MQKIRIALIRETETAAIVLIGSVVKIFSKRSQIYNQLIRRRLTSE